MRIRKAEAGDISAWMQVLHLVEQYFPGLCPEEYERGLEESIGRGEALVAEENGILGMAAFSLSRGEIEFLAVHPAARRRGVARELLKHILAGFPEGKKITVETYREGDPLGTAARALYRAMGFSPGPLTENFGYPCQRWEYEKKRPLPRE